VRIHELNLHDGHLINDLILEKAKANQTFLCGTTTTLCDKDSGKEFFAIGLQSGLIFIIDTNPLQIHTVVNASGSPQAIIWWHSYLLTVGYISSIVNVYSLDGLLIGSGDGAPTTAICHLQWNSDEQDLLWIGGYCCCMSNSQRAVLHQRKQALMKAIQSINKQMEELDMQ
ncbi:unnamed protein product, partial [Rotaria sordida]